MRLNHILFILLFIFLTACNSIIPTPTPTPSTVVVSFVADGQTKSYALAPTLTVREALAEVAIKLSELDRVTPPQFTLVSDGLVITVVRVTEQFTTEELVIPFTSQTVKNEALPEGERRLLQAGTNGLDELTYRTVFEDGVQVSRSIVKRVTLASATPEIIMLGSQGSFTLVPISGTLAYLSGQNAWVMRRNSGQRTPLTTSGDLDGFVFELSPDSEWLLFSRGLPPENPDAFNTLWVVSTLSPSIVISLPVQNTLYAEWLPNRPRTILYSDAAKITRAPGWQANNNLWALEWSPVVTRSVRPSTALTRTVFTPTQLLDTSSGGPYGWWGTGFAVAPNAEAVAYARTDAIGYWPLFVDATTLTPTLGSPVELAQFTAYNTHSDWAWYPALRWSPDNLFLFASVHGAPIGLEAAEDSPAFDFIALALVGQKFSLVPRAGMFTNPLPSPRPEPVEGRTTEQPYHVAYLQASDPNNSPFSTYRLAVMDRDGSNTRSLFPPSDRPGLQANETFTWSPNGSQLAVIYEGNLWIVDLATGLTQQLTGDGLSEKPRWGFGD